MDKERKKKLNHQTVISERERRRGRDMTDRRFIGWDGQMHYGFGQPGFYRGQYNGGSMGPCWTSTPIGFIYNCGG